MNRLLGRLANIAAAAADATPTFGHPWPHIPAQPSTFSGSDNVAMPRSASSPIDFFVSYADADRQWAEWIGWELENAGYEVRLYAWDHSLAGSNRVLQQDQDLQRASRLIAVVSPAYQLSVAAQSHWSTFQRFDPTGWERRVLPVEVAPTARTSLLGALAPVEVHGLSESAARKALARQVQATRLKPSRLPRFPGTRAPQFPGIRAQGPLRLLLALLFVDVCVLIYGAAAYVSRTDGSGNAWQLLIFLALVIVTGQVARRWFSSRSDR